MEGRREKSGIFSSSYKDISSIRLGPYPYDLIEPNCVLKGSFSK